MKSRTIHQSNLTSECWLVQVWGLEFCENCQFKDTEECGGKDIRSTGKNALNKKVPID